MENRPTSRKTHNVSGTGSVNKRGSGLGTGPVGTNKTGYSHNQGPQTNYSSQQTSYQRPVTRSRGIGGGKLGLVAIVIIAFFVIRMFGRGGSGYESSSSFGPSATDLLSSQMSTSSGSAMNSMSTIMDLLSGSNVSYETPAQDYSSYSTSSFAQQNSSKLDDTVAKGARDKRTQILGNGKDTVTIMVYMCGTDLESKNGMASADLKEMCGANLSDKVNIIVYTGGCKSWKTSGISNSVNQIYRVTNNGLMRLEDDMGKGTMTDPATLTEFIKYCVNNFPANRQELIMWDHGGGSISGYGYDEKNPYGSMTLDGINKALKNAGTTFDFIGFDACLMATVENGLMLSDYADYMIASEETEPGVGWYYTNWLTKLSQNTSMPTIEIGKNIVDDFINVCNQKCNGQKTTLSVVDLAELETTIPSEFKAFASSTKELIDNNEYKQVSDARYQAREFAQSSKIDQIDLVDFANRLDTKESKALSKALLGAVKYNRTSSSVSNAYGLSIYFPYKKASKVDQIVKTYDAIGLDSEYSKCIKEFASLEYSGQVSSGGTNSAVPSLLGQGYSTSGGSDVIGGLIGSLLSGGSFSLGGYDSSSFSFLTDSGLSSDRAVTYISENSFDASKLVWTANKENRPVISLPEEQWSLVEGLDLNVFYDDGEGYIDLGYDNVFSFDEDGNLYGEYDDTWLSLNGQVVPYYHTDTVEDGDNYSMTGYIPVYLNGDRAELWIVFDNANPYGIITGARYVYDDSNETVAKDLLGLKMGDRLDFICDYYTYDGQYVDSYYLGETMTLSSTLEIGNIKIDGNKTRATYCFTDIYQQKYWTPVIGR